MAEGHALLDALKRFFETDQWNLFPVPGHTALAGSFTGHHGTWNIAAQTLEDDGRLLVYSILPERVPADRRRVVGEYITRANYGLMYGNFEMDLEDGELRFKTSLDVRGEVLTPGLIEPVVYGNVVAMDRYLPGLQAVLSGRASPAAALSAVREDEKEAEE